MDVVGGLGRTRDTRKGREQRRCAVLDRRKIAGGELRPREQWRREGEDPMAARVVLGVDLE